MEIFLLIIIAAAVMQAGQHRHRPAGCLWCHRRVVWRGDHWVHADGQVYHQLGRSSAMHPAIPDRSAMEDATWT